MAGRHVIVATATASGKSLCFNVPVMEALAKEETATALYLFPTKAGGEGRGEERGSPETRETDTLSLESSL